MSRTELVELYAVSEAGPIPDGPACGVALLAPGTPLNGVLAVLTQWFGWQGKIFNASRNRLVNCVTPFHIKMIAGKVYAAPSLIDAKPCIVLDYSKTSTVARFIRDEMRSVAPGLYLGFAYWGTTRLIAFALDFTPS